MSKKFPDRFLWGASTSAMQVEGGIENNDWAEAVREGKAPEMGLACDFYNRYEEDFDTAQSLGHNANRFSVEWARIEPHEGVFDEIEIEHYKKMVTALRARSMEPFVTLWHFSLPLWFVESGSFGRSDAPQIFARYAAKMAEAFGKDVTFYITMNEPLVWVGEHGKILGAAPGLQKPFTYLFYFGQLIKAHKAAYEAIKKTISDAHVGIAKHQFSFVGKGPFGTIAAVLARYFWNRHFLNAISHSLDFIGIQFYQRLFFWQSKQEDSVQEKSDIGWQLHPEAIYDVLIEASHFHLPLYVSEAGIADAKDQWRTEYIKGLVRGTHRAIADGADVCGFFYWSLLDNYEFLEGFSMKFGLVAVDHENGQRRTVRDSAKAYAKIIRNNGL